jgi:hypothetical protein
MTSASGFSGRAAKPRGLFSGIASDAFWPYPVRD